MALGKNYSDAGGHAQSGHNTSQNAGQYSGDGRQPLAVVDNNTHHSFNSGNRPSNNHVVCPPPPPPPYGHHRAHPATGGTVNHALLTTDPYIVGTVNAMQRTNTEPLLADEEFSELLRDDSLLNRTGSGIFNQLLNENVQPLHVQMAQQDHQYAQPQQVTYVVIPNQTETQQQEQQQQEQQQQEQQQQIQQQQQQLQLQQQQQDPLFTISNLPSVWDNLGDELDDSSMSVSLGPSSDIIMTSDRLPMHDNTTNISIMDWPGKYAFQISMPSDNTERNKWCYSSSGAKLYLCPNIAVPVGISVNEWILGGSITITPVYKQSQHRSNPVHRCYQCKNIPMCDPSLIEHVVQVDGDTTRYHTTAERLQVSVPLLPPQMGEFVSTYLVKVMCLQTCVGGPNRRPFVLVFTLKNREDEVVGRQILDVKCCKCPSRDMTNDEKKSGTRNVHEAPRLDEEKRTKVRKLASEIIVGQQKKRPRIKLEPGTQSQLVNVAVPIEFASKIKKIVNQMILAKHMKQIDPNLMLYPEEEDSN